MGVDVFANPRIVSDIQGEIIMHRTIRRIVALVGFAAVLSVMFVSVGSSPAQAATRNGKCEGGEFCYYYNTGLKGSVSDHGASLADYGAKQPSCYEYKGAGAGKGQCVKNNAAAVWNRTSKTIRVYYNSNYGGSYIDIAAGAKKNLKGSCCYNNNASHRPKPASPPPGTKAPISDTTYKNTAAYISAGFDGYRNTKGRHEGIDIVKAQGAPVYALVAGTVIRVTEGARGSAGLSQIAVYNASLKTTIIYLHSDPIVSKGATIKKGQKIAYQDWRGVSQASSSHTHVEMRPGKHTSAAESVCTGSEITNPSDPCNKLENPNPKSFWAARGIDSTR